MKHLSAPTIFSRQTDPMNPTGTVLRSQQSNSSDLNQLGLSLSAAGRDEEATAIFRRAIAIDADNAALRINLGLIRQRQGAFAEAFDCFEQAGRLSPGDADPFFNIGTLMAKVGRHAEAELCFRQALLIQPNHGRAHNNLGNSLRALGRMAEAISSFKSAIQAMPNSVGPLNNLANALRATGRFTDAETVYQHALTLHPDSADTWCNLGNALRDQRRYVDAMLSYNRALQIRPDFAEVHFNRAWIHLLRGQFEEGWPAYEWRLRRPAWLTGAVGRIGLPRWEGKPFPGHRLLIYDEQGLGDTIQFARYIPMVKALGGTVLFETRPALVPLFRNMQGADIVMPRISPMHPTASADLYIPLMSLPALFRTRLDTIPWSGAYLQAERSALERWRPRLASSKFRIGIVWSGSNVDPLRACPPQTFAFLRHFQEVDLYCLQKNISSPKPQAVLPGCIQLGEYLQDFGETAAVVSHLDLVISVDTAVAHLAGALGKPTWVLLPYTADWRWLEDRDDSPWYPSIRLFRQRTWGNWPEVIHRLAQALQQILPLSHGLRHQPS